MYKATTLLLLSGFLFCDCSKKEASVDVETETPQAIANLIETFKTDAIGCTCHPYLSQYIWHNKNLYVLAINDELNVGYVCDWIPVYYDSNGEKLNLGTGYTYNVFLSEARFIKTIWVCE